MFVFWSGNKSSYIDIDKGSNHCPVCEADTLFTYRIYKHQTMAYSLVPIGAEKEVIAICHTCLTSFKIDKEQADPILKHAHEQQLI